MDSTFSHNFISRQSFFLLNHLKILFAFLHKINNFDHITNYFTLIIYIHLYFNQVIKFQHVKHIVTFFPPKKVLADI